jgi:hypothetical protein
MLACSPAAPEEALALALAATRAHREATRATIAELASLVDFYTLRTLLRTQGVLSLLGGRLLELTERIPSDFAKRIHDYDREAQRQGAFQQLLTVRLSSELTEAGIRTLPLKGPLLGEHIHGGLGARASADIDLLVGHEDLSSAVEALAKLDYRRPPRTQMRSSSPDLHECLRSTSGLPEVELHWRIHHYERCFSAAMLARATPSPDGYLQPTAPDELIALLLFYARDGMAGLRLLADLTGWWDRFADRLAPGEVDAVAHEHPAIIPALATAALSAQRLGGLPAEELFSPATLARASRRALRLANWSLRGRSSQIAANISLIDCLLSPRDRRLSLITRHFWRDEAALCGEWSDTALTHVELTRARILHMIRISGRWVIALWQLRRGREWAPVPTCLNGSGRHTTIATVEG